MTSNQISVPELVTIDQAQQIVRVHLVGHDQCIVKSLSQIENKGHRQVLSLVLSIWMLIHEFLIAF